MANTSNDYSDIFCQAVSNIVNSEISKLQFDVSGEYTVIKVIDKAYGKYQVTDGSINFEAVAGEGAFYEVGDSVIVTIPKGDYNKQASILSKITDSWSTPTGYVRPLDTMIRCTGNVAFEAKSASLVANDTTLIVNVLDLTDQEYLGFNKICVSAKFRSLLENYGLIDGTYGLRFSLTDKNNNLVQFLFSSNEMFGNPYSFTSYFTQEYAFDIPEEFSDIVALKVDFYQDGQFKDGSGNLLEVSEEKVANLFVKDLEIYFGYDKDLEVKEIVEINCNNLNFTSSADTKDVSLRWYHQVDTMVLKHIDYETFTTDGIYKVRWYQYTPGVEKKYQDSYAGENWRLLNPPVIANKDDLSEDEIKEANSNLEAEDSLTTVPQNYPLTMTVSMRGSRTTERVKAICFVETRPLTNDTSYIVWEQYHSKDLEFKNTSDKSSGGEASKELLEQGLFLKFTDGSYGNYYYYNQNGLIQDSAETQKARVLAVYYRDGETETPINDYHGLPFNITKISWDVPTETGVDGAVTSSRKSMISFNPQQFDNKTTPTEFAYTISGNYSSDRTNNMIRCHIEVDGKLGYTLEEQMLFGKQGSNGTTTTLVVEFLNSENALVWDTTEPTELAMQVMIVNKSGQIQYLNKTEKESLIWELLYKHPDIKFKDPNGKSTISKIVETNSDTQILELEATEVDENGNKYFRDLKENYTILKVTYPQKGENGNTINLERYIPIPIKRGGWDNMCGATEVLYNHMGSPRYNNEGYICYQKEFNENKKDSDGNIVGGWETNSTLSALKERYSWGIRVPKDDDDNQYNPNIIDLVEIQSPWIEKIDGQEILHTNGLSGLSASPLYTKYTSIPEGSGIIENCAIQDRVCVYCLDQNRNLIWSQPIVVMQSQYDFAMLNSWDGSLTIDEENSTILATMLGAGKKNSQNQFSGVLIGDIQTGTDLEDTEVLTGVYGLQNGIMTYALKEDGTGFFGADGRGRIEFDGTSGTIHSSGWEQDKSGNWYLSTGNPWSRDTGTLIDLDDGMLMMYGGNDSYLKFNENGDKSLKLSLSGLNIKLTDKTNNPNLSGYIDATAKGLVSEFRRTAAYYATCKTGSGEATKILEIQNFSGGFSSDNAGDNEVNKLTYDDIMKDGVTIAVTFENEEVAATEIIDIIKPDPTEEEIKTGTYTIKTGRPLFLEVYDGKHRIEREITLNNRELNNIPSHNSKGEKNDGANYFEWSKGSTIYFIYSGNNMNGTWEVTDSGSFSKITQTADIIRSEVSTIGGALSSSITQTAEMIETKVSRTAGYECETKSVITDTNWRSWELSEISNEIGSIFQNGVTLAVTFHKGQEKEDTEHRIYIRNSNGVEKPVFFKNAIATSTEPNALIWDEGDTLFLSYSENISYGDFKGGWRVVDSGAYSKIQQTADDINFAIFGTDGLAASLNLSIEGLRTDVFGENGLSSQVSQNATNISGKVSSSGGNQSFSYSLTSTGFSLKNNYIDVFRCDAYGVYINGSGSFSGNLTAGTTSFNQLMVVSTKSSYPGLNRNLTSTIGQNGAHFEADYEINGKTYKGAVTIGSPLLGEGIDWDDVTISPTLIEGKYTHTYGGHGTYGNLGTPQHPWDILRVYQVQYGAACTQSDRSYKSNIELYNTNQAYEELKNFPLYTYNYKSDGATKASDRFLGTMIDYMPIEMMSISEEEDGKVFNPNNAIFWHIGASQVMQKKIEDLEKQVQELQEVINNGTY